MNEKGNGKRSLKERLAPLESPCRKEETGKWSPGEAKAFVPWVLPSSVIHSWTFCLGFLCLLSAFTHRGSNTEVLNQQQHLLPQQKPTGRKAKKQVRFCLDLEIELLFLFFFFLLSRFWGFWFFCWVCFIFLKHLGHSYPSYCRVLYYPTLAVYLCHQTTWVLELAVPFRVFTCI